MKILLNVFALFFLLISCTSNTIYKKPENLIAKDTMVLLLEDIFIANSATYRENKNLNKDVNYMALVYEKYAIDSTRFHISNVYYSSRVEEYTNIIKAVKKRLELKKVVFEQEIEFKDSITKIKKKKARKKTTLLKRKESKKQKELKPR